MSTDPTTTLRLHSVRMKDGGATVRVLHVEQREWIQNRLIAAARDFAHWSDGVIGGYGMVVWDDAGRTAVTLVITEDSVVQGRAALVLCQGALADFYQDSRKIIVTQDDESA